MSQITKFATGLLLMLVAILLIAAWVNKSEAKKLIADNALLTNERDEARSILNNQVRTVQLFNDIAKASEHEKTNIRNNSEVRVAAIKKDISADECATRSVPVAAAERLRNHANQIRTDSARTHTRQPAF
ncbi:exotoxin [Yersinia pseudotuberculosis]|uniref:exotoxin n=1 Tax=Yersinia pseudotuberculosis TaxID=633 RepID=UPI000E58FC06|nr:exotoxin [Yersinia pseudotuberculosis]AXY32652.1 exotoxin [Yersinia pseudotuberculosis]